jgi:hypothetical protein
VLAKSSTLSFSTQPSVDAAGRLTFTPATNAYGTATVQATLTDNGPGVAPNVNAASHTFTITVNPVNDVPTLRQNANRTIERGGPDQSVSLQLGSGTANESQALTVTAVSDNPGLVPHPVVNYTSPTTTGSLLVTHNPNAVGNATITVTVTDDHTAGGPAKSVTRTFTVTVQDTTAPKVAAVYADSSAWTAAFRTFLQDGGQGAAAAPGYAVPSGAAQLLAVPFANLNRLHVRFSEDVSVQREDLAVLGVNVPAYALADAFAYDPATFTATWTLAANVGPDKLLLDHAGGVADGGVADALGNNLLDGEWSNGADAFASGDGTAGGDFEFRIDVLPGDGNGDGAVNVTDLGVVSTHFGRSPRGPRQGDFDGDADVDVGDLGILATNFNRSLPAGSPSGQATSRQAAAFPAGRPDARPVTALFGTGPAGARRRWVDLIG